jgi:hypothetical protein
MFDVAVAAASAGFVGRGEKRSGAFSEVHVGARCCAVLRGAEQTAWEIL